MSRLKQWRNGSWQDVDFNQWRNGRWVKVEVNQWRNGKWEKISTQKFTNTWEATWSQTYRESGTKRTDYRANRLCQGEYLSDPWGLMRSLCGFNDSSIRSKLSGADINDVKLYLHNEHWYYYAGGKAVVGGHNHSNEPSRFSHSKYSIKQQSYSKRHQAKWIDMPNWFGTGLRDGKYRGFSLYSAYNNMRYYGIFFGAGSGWRSPKIKISYEK
ncbi:hypothetical protein RVS70_05740 [Virgibacillus sp. M23]|uniref:hypothetical protein n=1 Tax=Virgibacillus sp. M23 TaxID=3079030 RepID=UPI002A9161E1|nr:hypothetical protein [Virgibacillus sp. M23]MDY7043703.1 hypothetical protein [Virgibacillus sp. M23]